MKENLLFGIIAIFAGVVYLVDYISSGCVHSNYADYCGRAGMIVAAAMSLLILGGAYLIYSWYRKSKKNSD